MAIDKIQSESINLADTFAFTGTVTGAGGVNTPAFHARTSSNQTLSNATWTKINFDTETFDTDNMYDHSTNYRFTPTVAGKYFFKLQWGGGSGYPSALLCRIYKNGTEVALGGFYDGTSDSFDDHYANTSTILEMNGSSDYVEGYAYQVGGTLSNTIQAEVQKTFFEGFKIIE